MIIESIFIVLTTHTYIMYCDQVHPSYITLSSPLLHPPPFFMTSFSGFHYAIFTHLNNVPLSYSPPKLKLSLPFPLLLPSHQFCGHSFRKDWGRCYSRDSHLPIQKQDASLCIVHWPMNLEVIQFGL